MANQQQNEEDDPWGDDDDDIFLLASQLQEQEEERQMAKNLNSGNREGNSIAASIPTQLCPRQAEAAFNMRREHLQQESQDGWSLDADEQSRAKHYFSQYQVEKDKSTLISRKLQESQGETANLRRQVESLKQEKQQQLINNMRKERELKQKTEAERRELSKNNALLKSQVRMLMDDLTSFKSKAAMNSAANQRLSVGGARTQPVPVPRKLTPQPPQRGPVSAGPKFKSDPSLQSDSPSPSPTRVESPGQQLAQISPSRSIAKLETFDKSVVVDEAAIELERKDDLVFSSLKEGNSISVHNLDSITSLQLRSVRQQIFTTLSELIQLDFLEVRHVLEKVVEVTPTEVMARFAVGQEFKVCFPDPIDSMYMCGVQAQRKEECEAKGEYIEVKYPKIPSANNPPIINLEVLRENIRKQLVHNGIFAALQEVKGSVKMLLAKLSGDMRFRLYEISNLTVLWHQLAWANQLWKFILIEEELAFILDCYKKKTWIKELKEWSGIILKVDWSDYYVEEIETIIRQFSLSILESVVTMGYFEESQKRYEILYCILKDTLVKQHLQTEMFLRQCLTIITWTVADRNILNYLCLEKENHNCLARLLGEAALQFCKGCDDHVASASLLVFYLNLLETLMIKQPHYLYTSKIARPDMNERKKKCVKRLLLDVEGPVDSSRVESSSSDEEEESGQRNKDGNVEMMDVDPDPMVCTQFADPDKYKFEEGCDERAMKFNNVGHVPCWINPEEWEVSKDFAGVKSCQCRKVLLGSAINMLYVMTEFWIEAYLKHEEQVDQISALQAKDIKFKMETKLGDANDTVLEKLQDQAESFREFTLGFLKELEEKKELNEKEWKKYQQQQQRYDPSKGKDSKKEKFVSVELKKGRADDDGLMENDDTVREWTWDELLRYQRNKMENTDPGWVEEASRPENIFDAVLRQGAKLMGFCCENSVNMALAIGSEGYSSYMFLESFFTFYDQNIGLTMAERRIVLQSANESDEAEDKKEGTPPLKMFDQMDEDDPTDYEAELHPKFDLDDILDGLEDREIGSFNEKQFEAHLKALQLEMGKK